MDKGISLLCIGSEGYMWWAVNMACTIRHYSPALPIQLIATRSILNKIRAYGFETLYDYFTEIIEDDYTEAGVIAPGKAKLKLPEYFIFERTIYLDIDGCVLKDLTPLFDIPAAFACMVQATYKPGLHELHPAMYWCKSSVLMDHYKLQPDVNLPAINSSFLLLDNTEANQQLFKQAYNNLSLNPIPSQSRHNTWGRGKGMQPDELYLNVACAQLNTYPHDHKPVYFRTRGIGGKVLEINDIREDHYLLGLYGGQDLNHPSLKSIYNRHVRPIFHSFFKNHHFAKAEHLLAFKVAGMKF